MTIFSSKKSSFDKAFRWFLLAAFVRVAFDLYGEWRKRRCCDLDYPSKSV
jgi:hypothetical protein